LVVTCVRPRKFNPSVLLLFFPEIVGGVPPGPANAEDEWLAALPCNALWHCNLQEPRRRAFCVERRAMGALLVFTLINEDLLL
jgi:hypothetical protein